MADPKVSELKPNELRWTCTEKDLEGIEEGGQLEILVGQERAADAFKTGLQIDSHHFNIYVSGLSGICREGVIKNIVEKFADMESTQPFDILYVYNFKEPSEPKYIKLKAGGGQAFKKDIGGLVEDLKRVIPEALTNPNYTAKVTAMNEGVDKQELEQMSEIQLQANMAGLVLGPNPQGTALAIGFPVKDQQGQFVETHLDSFVGMSKPKQKSPLHMPGEDGKEEDLSTPLGVSKPSDVYSEGEIKKLKSVQKKLTKQFEEVKKWVSEEKKKVKEAEKSLKKSTVLGAVLPLVDEVKGKYSLNEKVLAYLDAIREDVLEHLSPFEPQQQQPQQQGVMLGGLMLGGGHSCGDQKEEMLAVYSANMLVDNSKTKKRPIVIADNPHFKNLVGDIEKVMMPTGGVAADFKSIKAGYMAEADQGFLVVDVYELFQHPQGWEALKRVLKSGKLQIEDIYEAIGLEARISVSMKPEEVPVNFKVIMTGDERAYHALMNNEPDFGDLFNVKVQFDTTIINDKEGRQRYLGFLKSVAGKNKFVVSSDTLAALLEYGSTAAGSQERLSADFGDLEAVLIEAKNLASVRVETGVQQPMLLTNLVPTSGVAKTTLSRKDIETAVECRLRRNNLFQEKKQKIIKDGLFLISTEGKEVGQINGLAVYSMPGYMFGVPTRIITTTSVGVEGIISLDRAVDMTGPIHDKGVETISAYLGHKFGQNKEISLTASISFEQSYDGIEGDSASSTELYTLLSALSGVPIKQGLAVTGSVNKKGEVQVIGAVNAKIEGWYDICKAKGLTGEQGVLIPEKNMKDLMLKKEVIDAVAEGKFHIYPVRRIDEGIEILTGIKAGERVNKKGQPDLEGDYPEDTIFGKVDEKIMDYNYYACQKPEAPKKKKGHFW